jgi:RNA polymerase sigma factor (sigma-70 family)
LLEGRPAPDEWFRSNVPLIERLSRFVCRDARLSPADVDDFVSYVMLKLIDNDYAVLRKFEGRCEMSSYVIVVVRRAFSDFLARERGKYRPDREPVQRPVAVPLEEDVLPVPPVDELATDRAMGSRTVSAALRDAIGELPAEEQTMLRLHFVAGWSVAEISRSMRIDQQNLYGRMRRICKTFRARLIAAGIDAGRVNDLVGRPDVDLDFGFAAAQIPPDAPSSHMEEK